MEEHDVNPELEALQSTYADDLKISQLSPSLTFTLNVVPRTADDLTNRFVETLLEVAVLESYPETLPEIKLATSKGLGDSRSTQLKERLDEEARSMKGEAMLGQLCEVAFDVVTEMNRPEGDCGICLEPLIFEKKGQYEKGDLVKLSCFHVFHGKCFPAWWTHQQNEFRKKEQEMQLKTGMAAASRVLEKELPEKIDGLYVVDCPICRTPIYPADLKPWMDLDIETTAAANWAGGNSASIGQVLPAQDLEVLKQQQDEWAEKLAGQAKRGGIVDSNIIALALPDTHTSTPPSNNIPAGESPTPPHALVPPVEDVKNLSIDQGEEPRKPRVVGINGKTIALALPAVFGSLADDSQGEGEGEERDELSEMQQKIDKVGAGEKEGSQYHRRCSSHGDLVNRFSSYGGNGKPQQGGAVEPMGQDGSKESTFWDAAPQPNPYSQPRGRKGRSDADNWRDPGPRRSQQSDGGFPRGRGRRDGGWRGQGNNDRGRGRSDGRGFGRYGDSQDWGRGGRWRDSGGDEAQGGNNNMRNWEGGALQGRGQFSQEGRGRRGRGGQMGRGRGRGQDNFGFDGPPQEFDLGSNRGGGMHRRGRGRSSFDGALGGRSFDASFDPNGGRGMGGGYGQGPGRGGGMSFDGFMDFGGGMLGRGHDSQGRGYEGRGGMPGRGNFGGRGPPPHMNPGFDGIGMDPGFNDFGSGGRGRFGGPGRHDGGRGRFTPGPGFDDGGRGGFAPYDNGRGRHPGLGFDNNESQGRGYGNRGGFRGRGFRQNDAFGGDPSQGMGDSYDNRGRGRGRGRGWGRGRGRDGQGRGGNQGYQ
ncbi:hypothetical protein BSKO_08232 [Bryopsis sp. KO-2023]|nr:hypothetical protein BSKO_08232 [Bryopsis sp. KO-2023]